MVDLASTLFVGHVKYLFFLTPTKCVRTMNHCNYTQQSTKVNHVSDLSATLF